MEQKMDIPTLVERLRTMHDHRGDGIPTQYVNPDGPEAAERIEALERALEPFAQEWDWAGAHYLPDEKRWGDGGGDDPDNPLIASKVTVGDFRRAHTALKETTDVD